MAYTTINKSTDYFNTKLYTGNESTRSETGVGFQPDFTWIKVRSRIDPHILTDAVRGTSSQLSSDTNAVQQTFSNMITSFDSDGFSLGANVDVNRNSETFASWNWKAGTSVSGTTTGSGAGKAYSGSVSTDAGFSIIGYVGNGTAGHTIPHHLSAVPKVIIIKQRDNDGAWNMYNANYGNGKAVELNGTGALFDTDIFNNTTPTNSVFSVKTSGHTNTNNSNYIAYCFAEKTGYSKFGSYVGTNSGTNGPFIYTGFKPAFILIRNTSAVADWHIRDNKRDTYNASTHFLSPNSSNAEATAGEAIDILSNGFKIKANGLKVQDSGNNYIYMAFAEAPLVGSNNVPCTAR